MGLAADDAVEAILKEEIARESRALSAIVPVLRHLLASEAHALVSEAIIARVRGMILDLAAQLLAAAGGSDPATRLPAALDPIPLEALAERLMADEALLAHCHALAAESLFADRLQQRHTLDPVLSSLLQELIASEDPAIAALAMAALAAQSRFVQGQRRMELPLGELPAELFHALIGRVRAQAADGAALLRLQAGYDEATTRIGLLARLVAAMRRGAIAALGLDHAGLALFASALAAAARQPRGDVVLACHEGQGMRFALLLRASGASIPMIERQVLIVNPAGRVPNALAGIAPERAVVLVGASSAA